MYGHVRTLAEKIAEGVGKAGAEAQIYQVPETLPTEGACGAKHTNLSLASPPPSLPRAASSPREDGRAQEAR